MKVGVIYPQTELGGDPQSFDAVVRAIEALGYRSAQEHIDHIAEVRARLG